MNEFEKRENKILSDINEYDKTEINWSFFALFSNIIEKLNGGVSYARR